MKSPVIIFFHLFISANNIYTKSASEGQFRKRSETQSISALITALLYCFSSGTAVGTAIGRPLHFTCYSEDGQWPSLHIVLLNDYTNEGNKYRPYVKHHCGLLARDTAPSAVLAILRCFFISYILSSASCMMLNSVFVPSTFSMIFPTLADSR